MSQNGTLEGHHGSEWGHQGGVRMRPLKSHQVHIGVIRSSPRFKRVTKGQNWHHEGFTIQVKIHFQVKRNCIYR